MRAESTAAMAQAIAVLANLKSEFFAALGGEQFRIAQTANAVSGIENDGCGHDRAEQRAAADFIDSSNALAPAAQARFSKLSVQRSFFSRRSLAAETEILSCV